MKWSRDIWWEVVIAMTAGLIEALILGAVLDAPEEIGGAFALTLAALLFAEATRNPRRFYTAKAWLRDTALVGAFASAILFGLEVWLAAKWGTTKQARWGGGLYLALLVSLIPSFGIRSYIEDRR